MVVGYGVTNGMMGGIVVVILWFLFAIFIMLLLLFLTWLLFGRRSAAGLMCYASWTTSPSFVYFSNAEQALAWHEGRPALLCGQDTCRRVLGSVNSALDRVVCAFSLRRGGATLCGLAVVEAAFAVDFGSLGFDTDAMSTLDAAKLPLLALGLALTLLCFGALLAGAPGFKIDLHFWVRRTTRTNVHGDWRSWETLLDPSCLGIDVKANENDFIAATCVEFKSSTRLQCAHMRQFRRKLFGCASRTRREQSIRPKISRIDFDLTELENAEVWWGRPKPVVDFHTGRGPLVDLPVLLSARVAGHQGLPGRRRDDGAHVAGRLHDADCRVQID